MNEIGFKGSTRHGPINVTLLTSSAPVAVPFYVDGRGLHAISSYSRPDRPCSDAGACDDHWNANATLPDPPLGRDRPVCHDAINSLAQSVGSDAPNLFNEHADVTRDDKDEE